MTTMMTSAPDPDRPGTFAPPLCVCQFGPGEMQQHGFARNLDWAVGSTSADLQPDEKDPEVELVLTENDYTLKMWPYKFKAVRDGRRCRADNDQIATGYQLLLLLTDYGGACTNTLGAVAMQG